VSVIRRFAERSFSGSVRVVVGHTLRARQALARDIAQGALAVLGGAGAAMALFSWLVMRSALLPLPRIGAALTRRDPSDLTPLDLAAPREIAGMLDALNGFMARLDRQVSMNRAMIEDAAHQLRTPVAAIRAQAQLAEDEPDPARRARILARVHDRAVGLSRLLDQMLSQAMIIPRADAAARASIDLRDIAVEVLEDGETDTGVAGAQVRLDLPPGPVMVRGDALSLTEAGKNLLGNAIRHGRAPVRIGVRAGPVPALWISDAGGGNPDDLRAQAGERFAHGASPGGAGLGLAIARAVAESHDGALVFTRRDARFEAAIELPGQGA
jgi:two-component system sensor histidine kinase TctE